MCKIINIHVKKGKANYCETVFISKVQCKSQKGGRSAGQLGMFFWSPEDGSW